MVYVIYKCPTPLVLYLYIKAPGGKLGDRTQPSVSLV